MLGLHDFIYLWMNSMKPLQHAKLTPVARLCLQMMLAIPMATAVHVPCAMAGTLTPEEIAAVKGSGIDPTVKPGQDFNQYANGAWEKQAVIPKTKSSVGLDDMLAEESDDAVARVIHQALQAPAGTPAKKIADFYQAFLNTDVIDQRGLAPLQPRMEAIAVISDKTSLARYLGQNLRADVDPINATKVFTENLFGLWVAQGFHDHTSYQGYLMQGGLGLPDREYYLSKSPDMVALRSKYQQYVAEVLTLANIVPAADAPQAAKRIVDLETSIARGHASREDTSNVLKADHTWRKADFNQKAPGLDWQTYFAAAGLDKQTAMIIWHPTALKTSAALVASTPLTTWKDYLRFHVINQRADVLPTAFFKAKFAFYSVLAGTSVPESREKYAINATNDALGEEVGKLYVADNFTPEAKDRIRSMVTNLLTALSNRIESNTWLAASTKQEALQKIKHTYVGVGYPEKWRDYSALEVKADDAYGNMERSSWVEYQRALAKFGQPVDETEWCMNPQLVNAVNMPMQNAIDFPAAYLQSPNFDLHASDATNYGALGATIGHEISHSFDNTGAMFDSKGELRNWWTKADLVRFNTSAKALVAQFNQYRPFPDLAIKGQQTLGENIADLVGLMAAYDAYHAAMKEKGQTPTEETDREFFLAYAKSFRSKLRDEVLRTEIITNEHAPSPYRVQTVRNLDAWYKAFDVKPGDSLYLVPAKRVHIW